MYLYSSITDIYMNVDAVNGQFYMPPVNQLEGVGQGGGSRRAAGVGGSDYYRGNPFAELAGINGEIAPSYVDPSFAPTSYVNGINEHGRFSFMAVG